MLRGDIGAYAAFTEQGSSPSQMTAAKVMNVIAQAADAVSRKMEDAPRLFKNPNSECPDVWIRPPRHKWPKSGPNIEDPMVSLERNLYGHPLAGFYWDYDVKSSGVEMFFVHRTQGLLLSEYVDDIRCWKKAEYGSHVGELNETCGSWRTHIIS